MSKLTKFQSEAIQNAAEVKGGFFFSRPATNYCAPQSNYCAPQPNYCAPQPTYCAPTLPKLSFSFSFGFGSRC